MAQKNTDAVLKVSNESKIGEQQARAMVSAALSNTAKEKLEAQYQLSQKSVEGQAAVYFAHGEYRMGIDVLIAKLNETKGKADIKTWYMILDGYEVLGNKDSYEKLSEYFAKRFHMSAPQFYQIEEKKDNQLFGRNVLIIDGSLNLLKTEKEKDFIEASKEAGVGKIDLSRAKVSETDGKEGAVILNRVLTNFRKYKIDCQIMGEMAILQALQTLLGKIKDPTVDPTLQNLWELFLELLIWKQDEEKFESFALEFAFLYGISPPSYEKIISKRNAEKEKQGKKRIDFYDIISDTIEVEKEMKNLFYKENKIFINCKNLKRITTDACEKLKTFFTQNAISKEKIVFDQPNEILITIFEMTKLIENITVVQKKR